MVGGGERVFEGAKGAQSAPHTWPVLCQSLLGKQPFNAKALGQRPFESPKPRLLRPNGNPKFPQLQNEVKQTPLCLPHKGIMKGFMKGCRTEVQ